MGRCGYIALVGRPNVGKSTLLNRVLGQKVSITSDKPQTTRHRILGIKTEEDTQYIYVDTPGLHLGKSVAINRYMNRAAAAALADVDVVVMVVEALRWTEEDDRVVDELKKVRAPVILAVNKVDRVRDKAMLLPYLEETSSRFEFAEVVPLSAAEGENVDVLERLVEERLPRAAYLFEADQITDRSQRFLAAELIREKLTRVLRQELPYALTVEIEQFIEEKELVRIDAVIWVERQSHKAIVIGKGGTVLKHVGRQARRDLEDMLEVKVFLRLWVKVKEGWSDDDRMLRELGYSE